MNTLSHVSSSTTSTIQYMQHHLNMTSPTTPITTTSMPILPPNTHTPPPAIQQNNTYYSYSNSKISTGADMPLLLDAESCRASPVATPVATASKNNQQQGTQLPLTRKRTRATPEQLATLEKTFSTTTTPNNRLREQLSHDLNMPERSIQIWFQNRRAKVKTMAKRSSVLHNETVRMQHYAAAAAAAACQAATYHNQQVGMDEKSMATPDLYYYYYYYYYNQQVQERQYLTSAAATAATFSNRSVSSPILSSSNLLPQSVPPPPPMMADIWQTPPPLPPVSAHHQSRRDMSMGVPSPTDISNSRLRVHSLSPYPLPRDRSVDTEATIGTMMSSVSSIHFHQHRSRSYTSPAVCWPTLPYMQQQECQPQVPQPPTPPLDKTYSPSTSTTTTSTTTQFPVDALQIGTWGRMRMHPDDLVCHYNTQYRTMVWGIQNRHQQFKMEFNFDTILQMSLEPLMEQRPGCARLELRIAQPEAITFYMKDMSSPAGGNYWTQCSDFTQDSQATTVHVHHLDGSALSLQATVQQLVQNDPHLQSVFVDSFADMVFKGGRISSSISSANVALFQGTHHHHHTQG